MKRLTLMALLLSFYSCGDANLNGFIFVRDKQNKALDVLTERARYHYDQGEFSKARDYIEDALNLNSSNESVRILAGYIYLSLGGIDTFQLSKSLIENSAPKTDEAGLALAENSASGALSGLSSITGITDADLPVMGEKQESDIEVFKEYPVFYPNPASEVRSKIESLRYLNLAISMACPSVKDSVKLEADARHQGESCPESDDNARLSGKAYFLWAFAHLGDALSFNKVIQYSSSADGKANLQKRGEAAGQIANSDIGTYASVMAQLSNDINSIMQTDEADSQLNAVYNGLEATNLAFAQLAGVPEKITGSITQALSSLKEGAKTSGKSENEVLKGQLNEKVTNELSAKIEEAKQNDPDDFAENKTTLCNTFEELSLGQSELPQACK